MINISAEQRIKYLVCKIDQIVHKQVRSIFDNQAFIKLHSTWSALHYLINIADHEQIMVKYINCSFAELGNIILADDSLDNILSRKILDELDSPGNSPISILIGDYYFNTDLAEDIRIISYFTKLSSAAFMPFISGVDPKNFGIQNFKQLPRALINNNILEYSEYLNHLLKNSQTEFIGLVLPRILYNSLINKSNKTYCSILNSDIKLYNYVWGNPCYAFVAVILNCFKHTGWFLNTLGMPAAENSADEPRLGIIPNIRAPKFLDQYINTSFGFYKYNTECLLPEDIEQKLSNQGFIVICQGKNREFSILYNATSLGKLCKQSITNSNSISYILCVCRFAHYLKILGRQKIGSFANIYELEQYLNNWLLQYISSSHDTSQALKNLYPLYGGRVTFTENPFVKAGFNCTIYLQPHLINEQLITEFVINTNFNF